MFVIPITKEYRQRRCAHNMARALRLGLTLSEEDAKVFLRSEEAYAVTPQQKRQLREAQRIYQSHPIKF